METVEKLINKKQRLSVLYSIRRQADVLMCSVCLLENTALGRRSDSLQSYPRDLTQKNLYIVGQHGKGRLKSKF